jgi:hypothetical protein
MLKLPLLFTGIGILIIGLIFFNMTILVVGAAILVGGLVLKNDFRTRRRK